jgi:hypothetical protein
MCGGYGETDSNKDGDVTLADFFRDITDGGGAGYSGARFGGGTGSNVLDVNNDMYVSEAEYQRGQNNAESNADRGITGEIGDAYNNSQNIISRGSNIFGALPRGSIRKEAALGPQYGTPIETKNMARYLQGGGFTGAAIRGVSGFLGEATDAAGDMAMAPIRAYRGEGAPPDPVVTPEQQAISYDSIFNTGSSQFDKLPEDQRRAIIRGTRSLNAERALQIKMAQAAARQEPPTVEDYLPVENGMVEVIYSNGIRKRMTLQQARNNGIAL